MATSASASKSEDSEMAFWQNRKKLVKESALFQAFKIPKDHFEVFQLVCEIRGETQETLSPRGVISGVICSYRTAPMSLPKASRAVKMSSAESEKLFDLLTNLPVAKGETGVSVDYIGCRRFKSGPSDQYSYYCTVAAPVGLIPHTSLPIPEIPDEL